VSGLIPRVAHAQLLCTLVKFVSCLSMADPANLTQVNWLASGLIPGVALEQLLRTLVKF
jgi:hypothetical protein